MLEHYFVLPKTVDRIRASWIGVPIERYVARLREGGFASSTVQSRVPVLVGFGEFAAAQGAGTWEELPQHVAPFVAFWPQRHGARLRTPALERQQRGQLQKLIEEMIEGAVAGFERASPRRRLPEPFATEAPEFFPYLRSERGLRETSVRQYAHYLRCFETHLAQQGHPALCGLRPEHLRSFIERTGEHLSRASVASACECLRGFLRYLFREQVLKRDLSPAVERPRLYRMERVPRSIPWSETRRLLAQIDRQGVAGRRDFAIVLLLVTYGLRAHEVAALTLENLDWRAGLLRIPHRKAAHSTHYRLTAAVGEALLDYLEHGRPETRDRHIFFNLHAPLRAIQPHRVAQRATHWLQRAGIQVPRAGSHTLRHTVVQHLLDHDVPLQQIGDYVGHRCPESTQIYLKVDLHHLREIAHGYGEEALR
jgi:site-specific recombinase XerD